LAHLVKTVGVRPLVLSLLVATLCAATALVGPMPAAAQSSESPKISNSDEGFVLQQAVSIEPNRAWAQSFCTGPAPGTLEKVRLWTEASGLDSDSMPTVSLYANLYSEVRAQSRQSIIISFDTQPAYRVHTLTNPELDGTINTAEDFTSSGFELAPYTRYWVVVERPTTAGAFRVATRNGSHEIASGWSLGSGPRMLVRLPNIHGAPFWTYNDRLLQSLSSFTYRMDLFATGDARANTPPVLGWHNRNCTWPLAGHHNWRVTENTPSTYQTDDTPPLTLPTRIGTVRAFDKEGDDLTYSIGGRDVWKFNRLFELNSSTGAITVKRGVTIDYEETFGYASPIAYHLYNLTVSVTDGKDDTGAVEATPTIDDTIPVTIRVVDGDDPGTARFTTVANARNRVDIQTPRQGVTLRVTLRDQDGFLLTNWIRRHMYRGDSVTGPFTKIRTLTGNNKTYTPVAADVGKYLKVSADYIDGHCTRIDSFGPHGSCWRNATFTHPVAVAAARRSQSQSQSQQQQQEETQSVLPPVNSVASGAPTIDGSYQVGETLSALTGDITDPDGLDDVVYAYEWLADDTPIADATGSSYTLTSSELGKVIKVRVTFTDDLGNGESLISEATPAVTAAPRQARQTREPRKVPVRLNSAAAGVPTTSGDAVVGVTLSASTQGITDADGLDNVVYAYQWLADDTPIADATESSYELTSSEVGKVIKVRVTFTDDLGNGESLTSAPTTSVKPQISATVLNEPDSHDGTDFTFELRFSEDFYVSYKTLRDHAFEVTGGEVVNARRLVPRKNRRWEITVSPTSRDAVTVELPPTTDCTATGAICSRDQRMLSVAPALVVPGPNQVTLSDVDPVIGTAVTASLGGLGEVSGTPAWQWARSKRPDRGFTDINDTANGSNTATYTPQHDGAGYFLRATSRFRDGEGIERVVEAVTLLPVGVTATTFVSNTGQLPDVRNLALSGASSYQGFVTGDNPAGYVLTGAGVRFGVTIFDRDCYVVDPPRVELWTRHRSQNLPDSRLATLPRPESAERDTVASYDALTAVVLEPSTEYYLRLRNGACVSITRSDAEDSGGAPGWSIADVRLWSSDARDTDRVTESALIGMIDIRGAELLGVPGSPREMSAESGAESATVSWLAPGSTGQRAVTKYQVRHKKTGEANFGDWVDVEDSDDDGTDVDDERSVTLSSLEADEQYTLQVRAVNAIGGGPAAERLATPLSGEEVSEPRLQNSAADGAPTTAGDPVVGETLTASTTGITDPDGLNDVVYAYQWLADDADIVDADDLSYTLTSAEEGKVIKVRVTFTDDLGNDEALLSAATPAVKPQLSASVHDEPGSHDETDFTFELRFSEDFYVSYKTLRDHAFEVTGGEVINARRLVHGKSRRWEITVRPSSSDAVTVELPATTDCTAAGALCTSDRRKLTSELQIEVTGPASQNSANEDTQSESGTPQVLEPLIASVHDEPDSHDGTDFTFELRFSEDFSISYRTLRDHTFRVTGGEVINARRFVHGKSRRWEITVRPSSSAPVTIELAATTDCAAARAVCTPDQRKLSNDLTIQVAGPGS